MPDLANFFIDRLLSKAKHMFALPGSYNVDFLNKVYKSDMEVVTTTSEERAGFAADGYARINGLGVVCSTYCVGGFNLINATACAFAEKSPLVVIVGSPGIKERQSKMLLHHMVKHFECQHDMFSQITCANTVIRDLSRAGYEIDRVLTACMQYKQPVYIELPRDMIDQSISYDVYSQLTPKPTPSDEHNLAEALAEVAAWINQSKNPVIWAGVEVARWGMGKALTKFAEQTNIPVATTILGKSVINEKHPLSLGVHCERTSTDELRNIMDKCDCLIMLGVMMTDMNLGFMPLKYQKRNIILSTSETLQVRNHSYQDVNFIDFINGLLKSDIKRRESKPVEITRRSDHFTPATCTKITVSRVFDKINSIMNPNMCLIADVGDSLFGSLDVTVHDSHTFLSDAFYTSMGFAVPAALGAQTAKSSLRPIVVVGDGAFQMTGMEISTMVRRKLNPIIIVLNNGGYGTERLILDGKFNDLHNWNYEKIPMVVGGGQGFKVTTEEEFERAITESLASRSVSIINVTISQDDHTPALKRMFGKIKK